MTQRDPKSLTVHDALKRFPLLAKPRYEALKKSIEEEGVLIALAITDAGEVIGGRHRLRAAIELKLKEVPVVVTSMDPLAYAIEDAATSRNLTKTGVALLLLEAHPSLIDDRAERRHSNLKKGSEPVTATSGLSTTYKSAFGALSDRYGVPRQYFSDICLVREKCRPNSKDLERVRKWVFEDEISATNLLKALRGWQGTGGKHATDGDDAPPRRGKIDYATILRRNCVSLAEAFLHHDGLVEKSRKQALEGWAKACDRIPEDFKTILIGSIAGWPEADLLRARRMLASALAEKGHK